MSQQEWHGPTAKAEWRDCPDCNGTGSGSWPPGWGHRSDSPRCRSCGGWGTVLQPRVVRPAPDTEGDKR